MKRNLLIAVILLLSFLLIICLGYTYFAAIFISSYEKQENEITETIDENSKDLLPVADEPALAAKPRIGIYSGTGSWDINIIAIGNFLTEYQYDWSLFDEADIAENKLKERYDLIWLPGGFAAEYKYYITDHDHIRSFVEDGGLYVGSCAGAYYAADTLRWIGTGYDYPLKFFSGEAVGPLAGLINWGDSAEFELDQVHLANSGFSPVVSFYYFDGPYFEPTNDQISIVLASYKINNKPAVIAGQFGGGKYLLLGPHPELGDYGSESASFNLVGEDGAQWPWLNSALTWFYQW